MAFFREVKRSFCLAGGVLGLMIPGWQCEEFFLFKVHITDATRLAYTSHADVVKGYVMLNVE